MFGWAGMKAAARVSKQRSNGSGGNPSRSIEAQ
jgi:hypothetical protein